MGIAVAVHLRCNAMGVSATQKIRDLNMVLKQNLFSKELIENEIKEYKDMLNKLNDKEKNKM